MASNRCRAQQRAAGQAATVDTPGQALTALARHSVRVQIAAVTAAGKMFAGWAEAAGRYAESVGDELLRRVEGETDTGELIARLSAATTAHLCDLTALPRAATDHFDARLRAVPTDN